MTLKPLHQYWTDYIADIAHDDCALQKEWNNYCDYNIYEQPVYTINGRYTVVHGFSERHSDEVYELIKPDELINFLCQQSSADDTRYSNYVTHTLNQLSEQDRFDVLQQFEHDAADDEYATSSMAIVQSCID